MDDAENHRRATTREQVIARSRRRCERCGGPGTDLHHRRRRGIADAHTECTCNALWLCRVCHSAVHGAPLRSRVHGWIVSVGVAEPTSRDVRTWNGWMKFDCEGKAWRVMK